ncbi:Transposon Ty3-I Gag-Pol polyprotein [Gossypium australe]|uniref:Transposon Ty3-I Gag-Pol polyprotein n=1 Tax=Gossypium australe TaxID=47621 RepID=A0A5B6WKT2_9ROSI|nr:Transposon Ty3-I Gag-Pol polyprotein [Gossypium australe]
MFKQLGLGKPRQTRMNIQLIDKTVRIPRGIIENVLIKIDKLVFPVDFVVLDMDEDNNIPLILGRPFLATARAKIDIYAGDLTLRIGDEIVTLQALDSARTSSDKGERETPQNYEPEPKHRPHDNKEDVHDEHSFKVNELEKWKTHFKEELEPHEDKPKEPPKELIGMSNHLNIGDQILLNKTDPRITASNLKTNEEITFEVLNVFLYGTVEVHVSMPTRPCTRLWLWLCGDHK